MKKLKYLLLVLCLLITNISLLEAQERSNEEKTQSILWHGYLDIRYEKFETDYSDSINNANRWLKLHRTALWLEYPLQQNSIYAVLGAAYNNQKEFELEEAYLNIKLQNVETQIGYIHLPFASVEENFYPSKNPLITHSNMLNGDSSGVFYGNWRGIGFNTSDDLFGLGKIDLFLINGNPYQGAKTNYGTSYGSKFTLQSGDKNYELGVSYIEGTWDADANHKSKRYGFHIKGTMNQGLPLSFKGVYLWGEDEGIYNITGQNKIERTGYYWEGLYNMGQAMGLTFRYDNYKIDKASDEVYKNLSWGGIYTIFPSVWLKFEYQMTDGWGIKRDGKRDNFYIGQLGAVW